MARYNVKAKPTVQTVVNHQGGEGYQYDPKIELVSILATGLDNKYYDIGDRDWETTVCTVGFAFTL